MMGSIAVITDLMPIYSCHSFIREIRDKNVPKFPIKIPSGSRMTRLNEFHECYGVDSCHSSIRAIRDKIVPEITVKTPSGSRMNEFNDGQRPEVLL